MIGKLEQEPMSREGHRIDSVNDYVIETKGLTKSYNGFSALKDLNLKVPKNSIFAFLGPNGAGKTTTIKLLLGLIRPTMGTGDILGHDIVNNSRELRGHVGYLAQNPKYYPTMTAFETLRFAARFFYKDQDDLVDERIQESLELVGLEEKANRSIKTFSGGEMQRLGLAQAQINNPSLLILDEPASGLDPQGREKVLEVMKDLRKHTSIFYSTHILDDVQRVSDTVAILNKGQLIAQAPIEDLLAGKEGIAYTLEIKGDSAETFARVNNQDWVSSIQSQTENGRRRWLISVTDESIAEEELLRLILLDTKVHVADFKRREYELEEIFLDLVEESNNGN